MAAILPDILSGESHGADLNGPIIAITVGGGKLKRTFDVDEKLLAKHSAFFAIAVKKKWKDKDD
ncbi:hypothetical protein LTR36_000946 [Oleoguttula mirabilis]|uniref:Uncharacterized protein n=1 Tax=Oleoguttula mirabilis TaxID=1507867 RepID=A0AAV9JQK4_9PEZI|nr:hypothetical protein LTR36_000946 [Oleoguttula mirabilis]